MDADRTKAEAPPVPDESRELFLSDAELATRLRTVTKKLKAGHLYPAAVSHDWFFLVDLRRLREFFEGIVNLLLGEEHDPSVRSVIASDAPKEMVCGVLRDAPEQISRAWSATLQDISPSLTGKGLAAYEDWPSPDLLARSKFLTAAFETGEKEEVEAAGKLLVDHAKERRNLNRPGRRLKTILQKAEYQRRDHDLVMAVLENLPDPLPKPGGFKFREVCSLAIVAAFPHKDASVLADDDQLFERIRAKDRTALAVTLIARVESPRFRKSRRRTIKSHFESYEYFLHSQA